MKLGLSGLEVFHSDHNNEYQQKLMELVNKYNLLYSGGSDFHRKSVKPDIEVGTGRNNNIKIKELSLVNKINSLK